MADLYNTTYRQDKASKYTYEVRSSLRPAAILLTSVHSTEHLHRAGAPVPDMSQPVLSMGRW